jgi:hypothetical protein
MHSFSSFKLGFFLSLLWCILEALSPFIVPYFSWYLIYREHVRI